MLEFQISGPDAYEVAEALARGLEELGAPPAEPQTVAEGGETRDGVAVATLLLTIPSAILASWEIADRIGKIAAVRRWLGLLPTGTQVVASDAEGRSVALGAGGEAALIELANKSPQEPGWDIFLAYAGPDRDLAIELYQALSARGVKTFMDRRGLRRGEGWSFDIRNAQAAARGTVVLVSPHFDDAWYLDEELQRAIALKRQWKRLLIPVYRDGQPSDLSAVPYGLYRLDALDLPGVGGIQGAAAAVRDLIHEAR